MWRWMRPDIRLRLWIVLALLAISTVFVGGVSWSSLDRANSRLEHLHRQTLSEVAKALRLSRQSSNIATSAPFLLNFPTEYLIEKERLLLAETLDQVANDWPSSDLSREASIYAFETEIRDAVREMKTAIVELAQTAENLNTNRRVTQSFIDQIGEFENLFSRHTFDAAITDVEQRGWLSLLTMTNELLGAAHAENLLGVGEHRRDYQRLERDFQASSPTILQLRHLRQMQLLVHGSSGLFESRRHELSRQLEAQNALFRIRSNASIINELSGAFAADAESFLSEEREQTTTSIAVTKAVIVVSGLGAVSIALLSAVFVSKYVTANITAISAAMMRLAEGDKTSRLPKKSTADDEIGDLQRSFRVFRANALQLDRSNRRLNRQNALFERVFMNISDGVAISGPDGRLSATNPNFAKVLRLEADGRTQGATIAELFQASPISADATRKGLTEDFTGYSDARSTDGIVIEIRRSNLPDGGGVWLFSDATERRQVEDRLRQIQHIESLGKVAGEVAHDFGNILSSLSTNIHLLETVASGQRATELVDRAKDALEIGGALVQRLLAFARKQALSPEVVDLKDLAEGMVDLIIIGLKEGVHLDTRFCEQPIHVQVDPGQLESAILNICLNASQSIDGGGTISLVIETSGENQVTVKITDTGSGMDEKTLSRAFEPFFSARRDGTGTGLGLAMVYGFMKQSGGDVEIESTLGEGTEVRLVFPIANSQSDTLAEPAKGLRAVIVEDDAQAMRHAERCLSKGGFEVQTATNFACAMSCLDTDISPEVVVTDLHLDNGETGWKIAEFCAERHPSAQIIIVSGRLPDDLPKFVKASAKIHCLEKPLTQRNLRAVLQS